MSKVTLVFINMLARSSVKTNTMPKIW